MTADVLLPLLTLVFTGIALVCTAGEVAVIGWALWQDWRDDRRAHVPRPTDMRRGPYRRR